MKRNNKLTLEEMTDVVDAVVPSEEVKVEETKIIVPEIKTPKNDTLEIGKIVINFFKNKETTVDVLGEVDPGNIRILGWKIQEAFTKYTYARRDVELRNIEAKKRVIEEQRVIELEKQEKSKLLSASLYAEQLKLQAEQKQKEHEQIVLENKITEATRVIEKNKVIKGNEELVKQAEEFLASLKK